METKTKPVHLIDASVYVFRGWFALPDTMQAPDGRPINAVYGFTAFLTDLLAKAGPTHVAACFDESLSSSFRNAKYADYKANREEAPDALKAQFELCRKVCQALGVLDLASKRYEADDIIATLAAKARKAKRAVTIVTRDKDLAQLLGPDDRLWDFGEDLRYDRKAIHEKFGVWPEQLPDWQGLTGDAVDNIPGVRGIGDTAATALIARFGTLEAIYADLDAVRALPLRGAKRIAGLLESQKDKALLSRSLARLHDKVPMKHTLASLKWEGGDARAIARLSDELGFGERTRARLARFV
jgi:5'-3' exonuclease